MLSEQTWDLGPVRPDLVPALKTEAQDYHYHKTLRPPCPVWPGVVSAMLQSNSRNCVNTRGSLAQ